MKRFFIKKLPFFLRFGIIGTLFFAPLFFNPLAYNQFELQKLLLIRASIEALFAIYILWTISQNRPIVKWGNMGKSVFGFVLVMYLASVFGVDFGQSFLGNYWRGQGFFTLIHYLMLYIMVSNSNDFGLTVQDAFKALAASGFIASVGAVLQFVLIWAGGETPPLQYLFNGRYHVVFGNPNFFGAFLALCVPIVVWFYVNSRKKLWLLAAICMMFGIVLSGSKGALLGGFAGSLSILSSLGKKYYLIMALIIAVVCLFYYSNNRVSVYESRSTIWESGIRAFAQRPVLGWGLENFEYAYKQGVSKVWLSDIYVDKAHNEILEMMVAGGILGLAFYILMLVNFFKRAQNVLKMVMISFIFVSLTNILSVSAYLVFWLLLGFVGKEDKENNFKISKIPGTLAILLLIFLIFFNINNFLIDMKM